MMAAKKPSSLPRLLGEYLSCSSGTMRIALQKKHQLKTQQQRDMLIGRILLDSNMISQEQLDQALQQQRTDRLAQCPVFAGMKRTELVGLSRHFREKSIPTGQQFIMAGEQDPTLYVLSAGMVEVFNFNDAGDEVIIARVEAWQPIGEMGYFQGGIRYASVRAITPVELLEAPYTRLTNYFENVPHVAQAFLRIVQQRRHEAETLASQDTES